MNQNQLAFTAAALPSMAPQASAAASLTDRAVLARLTVTAASDSYTHKPASDELTTTKNAASKAARVVVQLWPGSKRHGSVQAARRALYAAHRDHSLPWLDDGARIVAVPALRLYEQAIDRALAAYVEAAEDLAVNYIDEVRAAEQALGDRGLFDQGRYPAFSGEWLDEHGADRAILPMPNVADLRLDVPAAQLAAYREQAEATIAATMAAARRDLFARLHDPLAKMAAALGDPKQVYRDSLMQNLRDAAAILPLLDPDASPQLAELARDAGALAEIRPQRCRDNERTREATAAAAADLARRVKQLADAI